MANDTTTNTATGRAVGFIWVGEMMIRISLVFFSLLLSLHGAELGPWNRTSCGAHQCVNIQKIWEKLSQNQCAAGVYSDYCDYQEYLCCEETSKCHSKLGKCIDLRYHKCKSGKLVLGYCEDWEDTPYTAFCCDADKGENDYTYGVFVTGWVFFGLCIFLLILVYTTDDNSDNFVGGFFLLLFVCFPLTLILTGLHYHLNGNTVFVIIGWSWVGASLLAMKLVCSSSDELFNKIVTGVYFTIGLAVVLLLAIEGMPEDPHSVPLYSHVPPYPSQAPTIALSPSLFPTPYPSTNPTVSSSPTSFPTASPTLNPTVSVHPTSTCGAGYYLADEGCVACGMGSYTNEPNQQSCRACEKWTYNHESGSQACLDTTTRNAISREYPVAVCLLYILLSLVCYALSISLGASPSAILTIALVTSDQVSDILYTWYSIFAAPLLLYLSAFFCIVNLAVPMFYILWYTKLSELLVFRWLRLCAEMYNAYDRAHGDYQGNERPKYEGWIFHSIHGWSYGEAFPYSIFFIPIDILWIVFRILLILLTIVIAIISQFCLLLIGVVFYATKLMSIASIGIWFWTAWNPFYLETHPQVNADDSTVVYNALILLEVISECVPQIIIQVVNTSIILGKNVRTWSLLTLVSISLSLLMIISIFYHFWYKHRQLMLIDPTYTQFDFRRIPKFDLFEKMNAFLANHRQVRRNIAAAQVDPEVEVPEVSNCLK
jgi:hypothetical protein